MTKEKSVLELAIDQSKQLPPGSDNYRAYVGPPAQYDFMGATQFALLFLLGLREEHAVLDVGCGSLRAGRLLLQYLLPGRYVGVEPNGWLWQQALSSEIGEEVLRIKAPQFVEDETFSLVDIGRQFDFVIFQSILSHTGGDMISRPLEQAAKVLKPCGQLLFTVLDEETPHFDSVPLGSAVLGWKYPGCVTYRNSEVVKHCASAGLLVQRLSWFHPRQSWYRAVADAGCLLAKSDLIQMGSGHPLFDARFA